MQKNSRGVGLVLKGEDDTWLELAFAEATGRLGKNQRKEPALRREEVAPGPGMVSQVRANQEMVLKKDPD